MVVSSNYIKAIQINGKCRETRRLHSHEVRFGRGQIFSVTGFVFDDLGNYWQVL